jgi:hypothetical protein
MKFGHGQGLRGSHTQCPSITDLDIIFFLFSDCSLFTVIPRYEGLLLAYINVQEFQNGTPATLPAS